MTSPDDKQAEPVFRESEQKFRALAEAVSHMVWSAGSDGNIDYMNRRGLHFLGRTVDAIGDSWIEFVHPDEREQVRNRWLAAVNQGDEYRDEFRMKRRSDGAWLWHYVHCVPTRDQDSTAVRWFATCTNVDRRHRNENTLRETAKRFRALVLDAPIPILVYYDDGRMLAVNKTFTEFTGYTLQDVPRYADWMKKAFGLDDQEAELKQRTFLESALSGHSHDREELAIRTKSNGERTWVLYGADPQLLPDGRLLLMSLAMDITDRKQADEQIRELNATLEARVAERTAVAELRATQLREMAAELTFAEQRERQRLAKILHDHLQQMLVAAKMKLALVDAGKESHDRQRILDELDGLLDNTIQASRSLSVELSPPILQEAGLGEALRWLGRWTRDQQGLKIDFTIDELPTIPDPVKIFTFEAVRELLLNVVKHSGVTEAAVFVDAKDNRLNVRVEDSGQGFDSSRLHGGSSLQNGFGLIAIRERSEALSGTFGVESAPGKGSAFRLSFALSRQQPKPAGVTSDSFDPDDLTISEAPEHGTRKTRVLVADDHAIVRQGLVTMLHQQPNIEVVGQASDGGEAVTKWCQTQPDVVVMDVSMPQMSGLEATRRILQFRPDARIIGLSWYEEDDMADAMLRAGAVRYLTKGGPIKELCDVIRQVHLGSDD